MDGLGARKSQVRAERVESSNIRDKNTNLGGMDSGEKGVANAVPMCGSAYEVQSSATKNPVMFDATRRVKNYGALCPPNSPYDRLVIGADRSLAGRNEGARAGVATPTLT